MQKLSVNYFSIDDGALQDIHQYLMNKYSTKKCLWDYQVKSLTSIVKASKHAKCIFVNNQYCMTQLTFFNLHLNE